MEILKPLVEAIARGDAVLFGGTDLSIAPGGQSRWVPILRLVGGE